MVSAHLYAEPALYGCGSSCASSGTTTLGAIRISYIRVLACRVIWGSIDGDLALGLGETERNPTTSEQSFRQHFRNDLLRKNFKFSCQNFWLWKVIVTKGPKTRHLSFLAFVLNHILHYVCFKILFTESKYFVSNWSYTRLVRTIKKVKKSNKMFKIFVSSYSYSSAIIT